MDEQDLPVAEISKKLNISRSSVQRWLDKGHPPVPVIRRKSRADNARRATRDRLICRLAEAEHTVERVHVTPVRKLTSVKKSVERVYSSTAAIAACMTNERNMPVSAETVRRVLHANGYHAYTQPHGSTLNAEQRAARVAFCKRVLRMPKKDLARIMFSDEKYVDTRSHRHHSMWSKRHKAVLVPAAGYIQGGPKVMVLGFMSRTNRKLCVCEPATMNATEYQKHLKGYMSVLKEHVFQQDGASPHKKTTREGFFRKNGITVLPWPAHSPDLNVIETIWAIIGRRIAKQRPSTVGKIKECVVREWGKVKPRTFVKLCEEFDERCRVCVEGDGSLVTRAKLTAWRSRQRAAKVQRARRA